MGYLGLFIHSGFGDVSAGSAMEVTDQEILIFTIEDYLAQLYFWADTMFIFIFIPSEVIYNICKITVICHLDICYQHISSLIYVPSVCLIYMLIYVNL